MIRVLQCVVGMNRGGLETMIMNQLRHIDRQRIQFDFLTSLPGSYDEEIRRLGGMVYTVPFIDKVGPFAYAESLRRHFATHPEHRIVHVQMDQFGGMVVWQAKKAGLPVRIAHSHSTKSEGSLPVRAVKAYYGRKVLPNATHLFACGQAAARWMFGRRANEAMIFPNSIDLAQFHPADTRSGGFTLLHIGRFNQPKNHVFLLNIFAALAAKQPGARLLLAGDGPLMNAARQQAGNLGLAGSVQFLGVRSDIPQLLAGADAVCMPSLHEGLPVTLIEAQACGVPCLVSDTVSSESDLTGDVSFFSLSASPSQWAEKLLCWRGRPRPDNRPALAAAGYDISATALRLEHFYTDQAAQLQGGETNCEKEH